MTRHDRRRTRGQGENHSPAGRDSLHFYPDIRRDNRAAEAWRRLAAWAVQLWGLLLDAWRCIPWATWFLRAERWGRRILRRLLPGAKGVKTAAGEEARPQRTAARGRQTHRRVRGRGEPVTAAERMRISAEGRAMRERQRRALPPRARMVLIAAIAGLFLLGGVGATALYISGLCQVSVVDRGEQTTYTTHCDTVGDFLLEKGIRVGQADGVEPGREAAVEDGMRITVYRAQPVYIDAAQDAQMVFMQRGTVRDALQLAGIEYDENDVIEPELSSDIYGNMRIRFSDIERMTSVRKDAILYETVRRETDRLLLGREEVVQSGRDGELESEILTVYQDGEEIYREVIRETVLREARDEIIEVGTKVTPKPTPKPTPDPTPRPDDGNAVRPSDDEDRDEPRTTPKPKRTATPKPAATRKPEATKKPAATRKPEATPKPSGSDTKVPGAPDSFVSTMVIEQVTAYTHTGNQVATGGMPQYTRSYDKPGSVAVDPKVIPYGTLLYIPGYGYGLAEDAGPRNSHIDLFMNTRDECMQWGRKRNMEIYIVETKYKR